jgi:hypothetical protein
MGDAAEALARKFGQPASGRFGALACASEPGRRAQAAQLDRVSLRIAGALLAFFASRPPGTEYHGNDLRAFIAGQCGPDIAPDSARRIASDLKAKGRINYACVDRTRSLFRVLPVQPHQPGG